MRIVAKSLSESFLFSRARKLLEKNMQDWHYPLGKVGKIWVGSYMILRDYGRGKFPPRYEDEQTTFAAEREYGKKREDFGENADELHAVKLQKPFWYGPSSAKYFLDYITIQNALYGAGLRPPAKLLEVGCGTGWLAEFLTSLGFQVLATTLELDAAEFVERRKAGLAAKGLPHDLDFRVAAMEHVHETVADAGPFDAVYVYEALHHAHDWGKAVQAFHDCLRPGGWCFVFKEPNVAHTLISYRVARLSNTHEIGILPSALKRQLTTAGFDRIDTLKHRMHCYIKPIWIAAQKRGSAQTTPPTMDSGQ